MTKFKIGDRVRAITNRYGLTNLKNNWEGIVTSTRGNYFDAKTKKVLDKPTGDSIVFTNLNEESFELVAAKKNKNQRITALEEEVKRSNKYSEGLHEQLTDALKRIEVLEKAHEPSTIDDVEDKPLSLNQQRAQIIEDANKFVEDCKDFTGLLTKRKGYTVGKLIKVCDAEFVVKPEKRTVVCILKEQIYETIEAKGIAKCNPSDVFNAHIGKAIALGRALGWDVSKFEQAVQPNEPVIGMKFIDRHSDVREIVEEGIYDKESMKSSIGSPNVEEYPIQIINDTNAQYGGGE